MNKKVDLRTIAGLLFASLFISGFGCWLLLLNHPSTGMLLVYIGAFFAGVTVMAVLFCLIFPKGRIK